MFPAYQSETKNTSIVCETENSIYILTIKTRTEVKVGRCVRLKWADLSDNDLGKSAKDSSPRYVLIGSIYEVPLRSPRAKL